MLTLTPVAGKALKQILDESGSDDGQAVRMVHSDQGFDMALDQPKDEDQSVEYENQTVLVLSPEVAESIGDKTMDVVPTPEGASLVLR